MPAKSFAAFQKRSYQLYLSAGVEEEDPDESPGLPGGVFEDRGEDKGGVTVHVPDVHVVRETIAVMLKGQDQSSPLWQAYASHEMACGGVKVSSADAQ